MSEEKIKSFLQDIIDCNFNQPLVDNITSDVAKDILDYITNLQEELEEEKRIEQASLDTINNLQEENEKLKKELNTLKISEEEWLDETLSGDDNE